jgi:hypothetical protein
MPCPNCGSLDTHEHVGFAQGGGFVRGLRFCENCSTRFSADGNVVVKDEPAEENDEAEAPETVSEFAELDGTDTLRAIGKAEKTGKDRKGVHDAIEARLEAD